MKLAILAFRLPRYVHQVTRNLAHERGESRPAILRPVLEEEARRYAEQTSTVVITGMVKDYLDKPRTHRLSIPVSGEANATLERWAQEHDLDVPLLAAAIVVNFLRKEQLL